MEMDREKAKEMLDYMCEVAKNENEDLEECFGVRMKVDAKCNYTNTTVTFKVEISDVNENGMAMTKEAVAWNKLFEPEMRTSSGYKYSKKGYMAGEEIQLNQPIRGNTGGILLGYNKRARKYPIRVKLEDGSTCKMSGIQWSQYVKEK